MKKKVILVIDDSETSTLLVKSIFEESEHYHVETLLSSLNSLEKIIELKPDLILLDVMMPDIDGLTLLSQIKEKKSICDIPVVVVSALDNDNDIESALELGAVDYIRKPIGLNNLYERVIGFLEKT